MIFKKILNFICWWRRPSFSEALENAVKSSKKYVKRGSSQADKYRANVNAVNTILENKDKK